MMQNGSGEVQRQVLAAFGAFVVAVRGRLLGFYRESGGGAAENTLLNPDGPEGGVALATIQSLNQRPEEQLKDKEAEISRLEQRLEILEKSLAGSR